MDPADLSSQPWAARADSRRLNTAIKHGLVFKPALFFSNRDYEQRELSHLWMIESVCLLGKKRVGGAVKQQ